ncbi:MAG TPA: 1-acyl-sn-glycerol-3-phosphate acyltransferase [Acidobacteriota bacterium]|nr:1-acyl-sn-glycerol-3-phosphate acyltransferase [Acidobacteriota bacterium]
MNLTLAFARAVARTFFREVVLEGRDCLPKGGPVIFTPNHPNGLLDPILLTFLSPPFTLHFVAKAPLFKIPVFGSILRSLGAIPVMRKMDAAGDVDYTAFFGACVESLQSGGSIVIFPEGRSLPQSYLAPLKTGPARLFLMAQTKGVNVKIVPVGLNYERGTTFRSSVLVTIAPPLDTALFEKRNKDNPVEAVRELTEAIGQSLREHVIQAETYRDRELMLLLERMYGSVPDREDWNARFQRLKLFESGLARARSASPRRIENLRQLLTRYERLANTYRVDQTSRPWLLALMPFAVIGWILNILPYHLVDLLVRRYDASDAATFKVVYSLFLFPMAYLAEAFAIEHWWSPAAAWIFAFTILPLSYFSQYMSDWWEGHSPRLLSRPTRERETRQLVRLKDRIAQEVDTLARDLERSADSQPTTG